MKYLMRQPLPEIMLPQNLEHMMYFGVGVPILRKFLMNNIFMNSTKLLFKYEAYSFVYLHLNKNCWHKHITLSNQS